MRITALFLLAMAAWLLSLADAESVQAALPDTDIEATRDYIIYNDDTTLMRYNPVTGERRVIVGGLEFGGFSVNPQGMVAYAVTVDGNQEIYVVDSSVPGSLPYQIIERPSTHDRPLGWSRDGRYLAFASELVGNDDDHVWLYVWDGEQSINITPHDLLELVDSYDISWSYDNRLAFTVWFDRVGSNYHAELYAWDGDETIKVMGSSGDDRFPGWSQDGQLAFLANDTNIYIWDGYSTINGVADRESFVHVDPELTGWYSRPVWTPDSRLSFSGNSPEFGHAQSYIWDGQTATNIGQTPDYHSSAAIFREDGAYAFVTWFSAGQYIYVRDSNHHELLKTEAQNIPAWGANNDLMYCTYGWHLTVWNGNETQVVSSGDPIIATWQKTGQSIYCTSG
ncbi:MAG: hypothetical protein CL607_06420 [Anaerolineaceae bacterium]|nr:hypothetical protein [Anaerolineaceae bacterium]